MNYFERAIYNKVADFPWLRKPLAFFYQAGMSLVPTKNTSTFHRHKLLAGYFYGFHDKIPWSLDDKLLLAHQFNCNKSLPKVERNPITVGFFSCDDYQYHPVSKSFSWNWQQGSMLQWIGKQGDLIFNDYLNGECARVFSKNGKELNRIPRNIGAVAPDGTQVLCYNYGRLLKGAPEYGYTQYANALVGDTHPSEDGLWLVNTVNGKEELLISLGDLARKDEVPSMNKSYHFVTHALFNPAGNKFFFLHRWRDNVKRLHSRLYIFDSQSSELKIVPFYDVSHISWSGNDSLFLYGWKSKNEPGYFYVDADNLSISPLDIAYTNTDGHPQAHLTGRIVTDSYPDRFRMQRLFTIEPDSKYFREILCWKIPLKYRGSQRCDFHPRWNRSGNRICIDTTHTGCRSLCLIELDQQK